MELLSTDVRYMTGYWLDDKVAADHPDTHFVKAGYLGDHPKVLETFAERATEQLGQVPPPNCGTCPYRAQILTRDGAAPVHIAAEDRSGCI